MHIGTEMRDGAQANFDYINSKGDGTFALFGYAVTPAALAGLQLTEKEDVPLFGPFTGAVSLHGPLKRNLFNVRAGYVLEMDTIIENLQAIGAKNIAVLYPNDQYGKAGLAAAETALKNII
jgi:branched-chain amino acid transport system substrate-binding protein